MRGPVPFTLVALATFGCGEPGVAVRFEIPEAYRADVRTVRLEVLEPPAAEPFDCDDVALGVVADETLRLSEVLRVALSPGSDAAPITGMRREGTKLFVGEAFDAGSRRLAAGCGVLGTVDEDVEVVVGGEPATLVEITSVSGGEEGWTPDSVGVAVTDARLAPLAGAAVRALLVGPNADEIETTAPVDQAGAATIAPGCTPLVGPALLDVRARWQNGSVPPRRFFQAFDRLRSWDVVTVGQDGAPPILLTGRFGPGGIVAFATATEDAGCSCPHVAVWHEGAPPKQLRTLAVPPGVSTIGVSARGDVDVLVARSSSSWFELAVDEQSMSWTEVPAAAPAPSAPARIVEIGGCGGAPLLLVQHSDGEIETFDPAKGYARVAGEFDALNDVTAIVAAGCVSSTDAKVRRVVAFGARCTSGTLPACRVEQGFTLFAAEEGAAHPVQASIVQVGARSVGFTRALEDSEPLLLGVDIEPDPNVIVGEGIGIGRHMLHRGADGTFALERVARDPTVIFGTSPAGGDVDGDGKLDVTALLVDETDGPGFAWFTALGVQHPRGRLFAALTAGPLSLPPPLELADFDGDGYDDIVIVTEDQALLAYFGDNGGKCQGLQ